MWSFLKAVNTGQDINSLSNEDKFAKKLRNDKYNDSTVNLLSSSGTNLPSNIAESLKVNGNSLTFSTADGVQALSANPATYTYAANIMQK